MPNLGKTQVIIGKRKFKQTKYLKGTELTVLSQDSDEVCSLSPKAFGLKSS